MPLSFFWGEEDFLIEKEINKMKKEILNDDINELNYKTVDNPDFATLIFLLRSQSMLFSECIYNIKMNRYFLETGKKITLDEKQIEEVIASIPLISDKIHIIFNCPVPRGENKKPDSRKKLYKAIQKTAVIKEFPAFKAYEEYKILPVLKTMLKDYNLKATDLILQEIIRKTGPYFRDLHSVLDKISLYIYPDTQITKEAIDNIYPVGQNIFSLLDLILEKNYSKTMFEISKMLQNSHYLELLAFLQAGFTRILSSKIYSKNMTTFEIARKTGQNEYAVKKALEKTAHIKVEELVKLKQNLTNAEFEIKTGAKEPMTALLEGFIK